MKLLSKTSLILAGILCGLTITAAEKVEPVEDYSTEFGQLEKLGLPNVKDTTYVKLTIFRQHRLIGNLDASFDIRLLGNAWMLDAQAGEAHKFIVNGSTRVTVYNFNELHKKKAESTKTKLTHGQKISGTWKKADLKEDIKKVMDYLDHKAGKRKSRQRRLNSQTVGHLFLFAAHVSQKGYSNEANKIIARLIKLSKTRQQVMLQALDQLASGLYKSLFLKFAQGQIDWQQYQSSMENLLQKFSQDWSQKKAVEKLISMVKTRITQKTPPEISGNDITKQQQKWAAKLASGVKFQPNKNFSHYDRTNHLWVLNPPQVTEKNKEDIIAQIKSQGIKAIPFLLAMVKDTYLTGLNMSDLTGNHTVWSNKKPDADDIFNSMPRPATRGDIARALLAQLLISENQYGNAWIWKLSDEELTENCKLWESVIKDRTKQEIALLYIEEGNPVQKTAAIDYIIDHTKLTERNETLEDIFLDSPSPYKNRQQIINYVTALGEKSKPFIDSYEQALLDANKSKQRSYKSKKELEKHLLHQQKQIDDTVSNLKTLMVNCNSETLLKNLVSKKTTWNNKTLSLLLKMFSSTPTDQAIKQLLTAAIQTDDLTLKKQLINTIKLLSFRKAQAKPASKEKLNPTANKMLWQTLLKDKQTFFQPNGLNPGNQSIAQVTADCFMSLYDEKGPAIMINYLYSRIGKKAHHYQLERIEALQNGQPVPKRPSETDVLPAAREAVIAKLQAASSQQLKHEIESLTGAEQLCLPIITSSHSELCSKLLKVANKVTSVQVDLNDAELAETAKAYKNKDLTPAMIKELFELVKNYAHSKKKPVFCLLKRNIFDGGTSIILTQIKPQVEQSAPTLLNGQIIALPHANLQLSWDLKSSPGNVEEEEDFAEIEEEMAEEMAGETSQKQQAFWQYVDNMCSTTWNPCTNVTLTFQTK